MVKIVDIAARDPFGYSSGGVGTTIYNTAKPLAKSGIDITVICYAEKNFTRDTEIGRLIGIKVPDNELLKIIIYSVKAAFLSRKLDPDILIGEGPSDMGASLLATLIKRRKVIHIERAHGTHMGLILSTPRKSLHMALLGRLMTELIERYEFALADYVVSVSESVRTELIRYYHIKSGTIKVVTSGADTSKYKPLTGDRRRRLRRSLNMDDGRSYGLYIGTDPYRKGLDIAVQAILEIGRDDICLNIIGISESAARKALEKEGIKLHREKSLFFVGSIDDKRKADYLAASDFFLFPSRYEGIALVAMEAMSSGLPVIVSSKVHTDEIGSEKDGVFVVSGFDPKAYADRVKKLVSNKAKLMELGRRTRKAIRRNDWKKVAKRYLDVIRNIIRENAIR